MGHDVSVLDDASRGARSNLSELEGAPSLLVGDVRDRNTVEAACRRMDVVVHLAAVQGTGTFYRAPDRVLDVNVGGTLEVVRAAAFAGVRRLVFASSSEVYADPPYVPTPETVPAVIPDVRNPRFSYSGSKLVGELLVIHFSQVRGLENTILRYHNVYGPKMGWDHVIPQFITRLERGEAFTVQGDGTQTRAFCFVSDAVDATIAAITRTEAGSEIMNVGNDEREWTINELIEHLERVSARRISPVYVASPPGSTPRRMPDISRARRILGYSPRVSLPEGLATTYAWYKDAIARGLGPAADHVLQ